MADIAGLEPASCGFESRSPHHYQSSDSSTDRMLGYEPGDVGSITPSDDHFPGLQCSPHVPSHCIPYPRVNLSTGQLVIRSGQPAN